MQLVGREKELAAVERAVRDAQEGSSRALGLLGEAGIGKSALLIAAREQSREGGMLVLEGRGAEHEQDVPFGLVVDALDDHVASLHPRRVESLGPDLGAVLPAAAEHAGVSPASETSAAERFRYHRALRALIEMLARERPVTLLLDDLHWADDASIELVLHLLRRPPRSPHLLAFALRPIDPAPRLLDAARATPAWTHLQLEPLGREASLELVDDLPDPDLRERVVRDAGGNPLFLQELTRAARQPGDELPATLLAAVQLEVGTLPRATRMLLDGAAVAGDPFDPELAAEAGGLAPGDALVLLDRLVAADLVRATGGGRAFRFRHPLVRRAVYDAAPPAWRLAAHERAAEALEQRGAAAALRAYHVEQSAKPGDEAAIAVLSEAAAAATDTAPVTAARWYAAAERLLPDGEPLRHAMLLGPRALALASAGRLEESHESLVRVLDLLPREPTPQRLALVAACAGLEGVLGRHAEAKRRLLAALEDAPPDARAALALEMAVGAFWRGDSADMREWAEHAAKAAGDDSVLAASAGGLGALGALWQGDPDAAYATLDGAAAVYRAADDDAVAARLDVARNLGIMEMHAERFADAEATGARAAEIARRTRQGHALVPLLIVRAMALVNLLDLESAVREAEAAEEGARLQGVPHLLQYALWEKAVVHHFRGEALEAERAGAEFWELLPRLEPSDLTRTGSCSVAALSAAEDPERCIADMLEAAGTRVEEANPTWSTWLLLVLTRAGIAAGRLEEADDWATRAFDHAAALRLPAGQVRGAMARAEVLLAREQAADAAELALEAVATGDRVGAPRDAVEARLLAGRALTAAGKRPQAVEVLQRAAADATRGCAFQIRDAAAAELRTLGVRLPTAGRSGQQRNGQAALSKREREIAELVAEGRSNKQVAAALFLSDRTVEYHLSAVYKKLGVRSRTQLAATLGRE